MLDGVELLFEVLPAGGALPLLALVVGCDLFMKISKERDKLTVGDNVGFMDLANIEDVLRTVSSGSG